MPVKPEYHARQTIKSLERRRNSVNGNPHFKVGFTDGTSARTAPNSLVAFVIDNREYWDIELLVTYNGRGQIVNIEACDQ